MLSRILPGLFLAALLGILALGDEAPVRASITTPTGTDVPGDVNCDNELTGFDPLHLLLGEAGLPANDDCANANSDFNCDQTADETDVPQILRLLAGLQPEECPSTGGDPTSIELIDEALLRGDIDEDEAITYKLYYLFGDDLLPDAYTAPVPEELHGESFLRQLNGDYNSLSPAMQAVVGPYLVQPFYEGSWWHYQNGASPAGTGSPVPPCTPGHACGINGDWESIAATNGKARIWYPKNLPTGASQANRANNDLAQGMWTEIGAAMGREPLSDAGYENNGGDGLIDIAITGTDILTQVIWMKPGCFSSPGYMVMSEYDRNIMAHESMHLFEIAFGSAGGADVCDTWDWIDEGVSNWAVQLLFPDETYGHLSGANFINGLEFPLDYHNDKHEYGTWLFWLYLSEHSGTGIIGQIYAAREAEARPLYAIESVIPGGFAERWPEFAAYAWNRAPDDYLRQWDDFDLELTGVPQYEVKLEGGEGRFPGVATPASDEQAPPLTYLSAVHYQFKIDPAVRSIAIYNGLTNKLIEMDTDLARLINIESYSDNEDLHISLLRKIGGVWQEPIDWTNFPFQNFCLDVGAERVEEVVLVATNAEYQDRTSSSTIRPEGLPVTALASDIGCWRWEGDITQTLTGEDGFHEVTELKNGVFERDPSQVGLYGGGYNVNYIMTGGGIDWEVSGTQGDCTVSGNASGLTPIAGRHVMGTINHTLSGPYHRSASGSITAEELQTVTQNCPGDPPDQYETTVGVSFPFHEDASSYYFEDGGVIDGTSSFGPFVVQYHLEAIRE